jgi:hypothetical protein
MKAWSILVSLDLLLKRLLFHFMTPIFLLIAVMAYSDATHCNETSRALIRGSAVASGTIDHVADASRRSGPRRWRVDYTFPDWSGRTHKGWQTDLGDRDWKVGAGTVVFYDGTDPLHNALDIRLLAATAKSNYQAAQFSLVLALLTGIFQIAVYWRRYKHLTQEPQVDQSGDALATLR